MKGKRIIGAVGMLLLLLTIIEVVTPVLAQDVGLGIMTILHGTPQVSGQQVQFRFSVIDIANACSVDGLTSDQIKVEEDNIALTEYQVDPQSGGLAIVAVLDRGYMGVETDPKSGDARGREAAELVLELLDRLSLQGNDTDDMLALIGVAKDDVLSPRTDFTWTDPNLVRNAVQEAQENQVEGVTAMYEGLDEALRLLTDHPNKDVRQRLANRRKVIILFTDGIDNNFSEDAQSGDVIRKALAADISIYAIGMGRYDQALTPGGEANLLLVTKQTYGQFQLHNNETTHEKVLALFDDIMTQRQQYVVTYNTTLPKGTHSLDILVDAPAVGSDEIQTSFSSILEPIQLNLTAPADGLELTVEYTSTTEYFLPKSINLTAQVETPDGVDRNTLPGGPLKVRYLRSGTEICSSTDPESNYLCTHELSTLVITPTEAAQYDEFTFRAEVYDPLFKQSILSTNSAKVKVKWEGYPFWPDGAKRWLRGNWGFLIGYAALGIGVIVLVVLMIRTRGDLARRVVQGATGVMKALTRKLTPEMAHPWGKMTVIQGNSPVREFPLVGGQVRFGRNPQFCDCPLYDDFASNPHFTVFLEGTEVYIQDEGSTNKTRLNGVELPPHVRQILPSDATIDAGMTRLQFKRTGLTTQVLDGGTYSQQ